MSRLTEIQEELRGIFSGRGAGFLDVIFPLAVYLGVSRFLGIETGVWSAIGAGSIFFVIRLVRKQSFLYALAGLGGVILAAAAGYLSGREEGFFLPGLISGSAAVLLSLVSVLLKRPVAAYSSHITRRWPLDWYWHPRIRPAYSEVSLFWAVGFAARLGLEFWLFQTGNTISLGLVRTLLGWPYTVVILVLSYLYGIWRLGELGGPGVEEYRSGKPGPWEGQKRGF